MTIEVEINDAAETSPISPSVIRRRIERIKGKSDAARQRKDLNRLAMLVLKGLADGTGRKPDELAKEYVDGYNSIFESEDVSSID
jgi:hypothetical protein